MSHRQTVHSIERDLEAALETLAASDRENTSLAFLDILDRVGDLESRKEKYDHLRSLSDLLARTNFPDLALMALQEAIDLNCSCKADAKADELIEVGRVSTLLGNWRRAEASYIEARSLSVASGSLNAAARATTNLAQIRCGTGRATQAIELLEESLTFLNTTPDPHTEAVTRLTLIQAIESAGRNPKHVFDHARALLDRLSDQLAPHQLETLAYAVGHAVDRHLHTRSERARAAWILENFPRLAGPPTSSGTDPTRPEGEVP